MQYFHDRFSTTGPGNTQSFYVVKPDGSRREISAYVNSKTGNIWYMNRGLPDFDLSNGEHITFVQIPATTETAKELIYVSMQVAYGDAETLATGYITPLLQEALVVTSGADIKSDLLTIQDKEDQIQGNVDEVKYQGRDTFDIVARQDDASTKVVTDNIEISVETSIPTVVTRRFMGAINIPADAQHVIFLARFQKVLDMKLLALGKVYLRMREITHPTDFDPTSNYFWFRDNCQ